ncbi:MAG: aminoglycoside phosphotransferase family protein [Nanoarchaeota archaeon]
MNNYLFSKYKENLPKNISQYLSSKLSEQISSEDIIACSKGCNSFGYEVKDYIVRFALNEKSWNKLEKEKNILDFLQDRVSITIPKTNLFYGEYPFSIHNKIRGEFISEKDYFKFSDSEKDKLANNLSLFFSEMHKIPLSDLEDFIIPYWDRYEKTFPNKDTIFNTIDKKSELSLENKNVIFEFIDNYLPQKFEIKFVLGHFDIMSKNLVFDLRKNKLNGIFDFGDCGIGHYLYDFSQMDLGLDLWKRMKTSYEKRTNNKFDVQKIKDHSLFSALGFYVNYLNGIEKIQKDCLEKLIKELKDFA